MTIELAQSSFAASDVKTASNLFKRNRQARTEVVERNLDVDGLGQVFTPSDIVEKMIKMRKNNGRILEPSCGDGAFSSKLPGCVAIELDTAVAPESALNMDFFDYPISEKFDTIIGNPPYVRYQDISSQTKKKLDKGMFDERSNLYLFFIKKCIDHLKENGELIFIVPRDFLKATSSIRLNEYIYENGTITDIIDLGDRKVFEGATPNCVIFRFEKDDFSRETSDGRHFILSNGQLLFVKGEYTVEFSDLFFVKVGAVSGADKIFASDEAETEFVCSKTRQTGETRKMFYNVPAKQLEPFKEELLARRIKKFDRDTWYMWGRGYYESDAERIYVNAKTRVKDPFFCHDCKAYDGSVLAMFPRFRATREDCEKIAAELNNVNWEELGFVCDGRFLFSQKSLENCLLPNSFEKYRKKLLR